MIRYDAIEENVDSKAECGQLNIHDINKQINDIKK